MFKYVNLCRCCGSDNLELYLNLGDQPFANSYHKGEELPRIPLQVMFCHQCSHSQLSVVADPDLLFKHYLYVSGTTNTFRKHCQELADDAFRRKGRCRVLDIACNDGTLLECFRRHGCDVWGVDPATNLRQLTLEKNIPVTVGYWGDGAEVPGMFDVITGTNVFAHVDQTAKFLEDCKEVLNPDGIVILEFPYCNHLVEQEEFDTIYHEHLSYFLVRSFSTLAQRTGFRIVDIITTPIHGGSIRFFLKASEEPDCPAVQEMIEHEASTGLHDIAVYRQFAANVLEKRMAFSGLLEELTGKRKIIGYGASAKGNTMLNTFGVKLEYIVDDNEMKWGYLTPGQDIPIRSPQDIAEENELYIVILAWNFAEEIVGKVKAISAKDHKFINYVPQVGIRG